MSRTTFLIIWVVFAALLFAFMLFAWRRRVRRDAGLVQPSSTLAGEILATFAHVAYVATTPIESPLNRVAIPGLAFKGWAELTVRADGVVVAVTGEQPVEIPASQLLGLGTAASHMNRAVGRDGLAMLKWRSSGDAPAELESSFRFDTPAEQLRFGEAIGELLPKTDITNTRTTSQENA